jgi:CubicO group peptidase (beta-lactamase class C family)
MVRSAAFFALVSIASAQDTARMDDAVRSFTANHFMGTVLVARGDQVLFSKGYGFANLEWDVPNTPETKFRVGSVTKQFTAVLILKLEEQGKLNVNDPVKKYVPDAPAAWDKITLFHLLTHTSGLPDYTNLPDYTKLQTLPTSAEQIMARFRDKPLEFQPGEKMKYCNSGYVILTYVIEKITGGSYEKFLQDQILTPLGLKDTGYDSAAHVIRHRATGYLLNANNEIETSHFVDMTVPQGAGALYSTTGDLLKWELALFGGNVLKPASLEKMTTPFLNHYGFGLFIRTDHGRKMIEHTGGIDGFNTDLAYYPDEKLTIVVFRNVNTRWRQTDITAKLASVYFGDSVTLDAPARARTEDVSSMDGIVAALYDVISGPAGKKRDWDRFRSLFVPAARLIPTAREPSGRFATRLYTVDDYALGVGPNLERSGFFEKEVARRTETFGKIAQLFSTYESRRNPGDPKPFARGINSIQLMNDGTRWWIVDVYWQAERPDNPIPAEFLPKP